MVRGKSTDGYVSRYINRRFSTRITQLIIKHNVGITPNQVSLISSLIGFLAFPLYLLSLAPLAGILAQVSSIVDGVDGELARARGISSKFGAFFDALLDRMTDSVILIGASLYVLAVGGISLLALAAGLFSLSGSLLVSYLHARSEKELGEHPVMFGRMPNLASRDVRLFIIFVGSLFNMVFEALLIVAIITNLYVIVKFIEMFTSFEKSLNLT